MIPCSNVAHLYRERVIWTFRDEGIINKIRFAEVWMDEYKEIFQRYNKVEGVRQFYSPRSISKFYKLLSFRRK